MKRLILIAIMAGTTGNVSADMCSTTDIYGNHVYVACERRDYSSANTFNSIPRYIQNTTRNTHMSPLDAMRQRQMQIRQRDMQLHANRHRLALDGNRTAPRPPFHMPHMRQMQSQQNNLQMQLDNQDLEHRRRGYEPMILDALRFEEIQNQQHEIELQIEQLQVEKARLELERQRLESQRKWQADQAARQQLQKEQGYPRLIIR